MADEWPTLGTIQGKGFSDRSVTICIPTRTGQLDTRFVGPLLLMRPPLNARREILFSAGMEVAEAYNALVTEALKRETEFIMTLEDDQIVTEATLATLVNSIGEYDAISALYYLKDDSRTPCVFGDDLLPLDVREKAGVVSCRGIPFGCGLWRRSLFEEVGPGFVSTVEDSYERWTHDLYFAKRLRAEGKKVAVHLDVKVGHIDYRTGKIY